jgi:Fur family transcriptional regulator, ferric uptake regulator
MAERGAVVAALDRGGRRLTESRLAVAALIATRQGHFTAADLVEDARASRLQIGRATIFRSLEMLLELGVVERIDLPSGEHAYVGCQPSHHHHVVCSSCGRSADFDDVRIAAVVADAARRTGFQIESHRLELFGTCAACRASAKSRAGT